MSGLEEKIRIFLNNQGVRVMGIAGPERLDGPPSLDPTYTMRGAKSIVSIAMPMDVDAIYDFLSKKRRLRIIPISLSAIRKSITLPSASPIT